MTLALIDTVVLAGGVALSQVNRNQTAQPRNTVCNKQSQCQGCSFGFDYCAAEWCLADFVRSVWDVPFTLFSYGGIQQAISM